MVYSYYITGSNEVIYTYDDTNSTTIISATAINTTTSNGTWVNYGTVIGTYPISQGTIRSIPQALYYKNAIISENGKDTLGFEDERVKISLPPEVFEEVKKRIDNGDKEVLKSLERIIKELENWPESSLETEW